MKRRWDIFIENIQADLKVFLFIWLYLMIGRIIFVFLMREYLDAGTVFSDIAAALYYGARLSLKTAGIAMLLSFLLSTVPNVFLRKNIFSRLRLVTGGMFIFLLNVLLMARFPYYLEFHTGFNQMIFNGLKDDQAALFQTMVTQYAFWPRIVSAFAMTGVCLWLMRKLLLMGNWMYPQIAVKGKDAAFRIFLCLSVILFAVFIRFGGSFTYANSLHWENCSLSKDAFLNEVILDDVQAVYRGYSIKKRIENGIAAGVDQSRIRGYLMGKNKQIGAGANVDDYLRQKALGAAVKKPNHVFVVIGESYAQWPLLQQYEQLHLADGVKSIMEKEDADSVKAFLPNGAFTPMAVNAVISGLSDVNIYPNHQAESYRRVYQTALAPQLKKLGYQTVFWYAGFSAWERIRDFALAQGFDEFHSASDFPYKSGNVWGCDDEYLFDAIRKQALVEEAPTVHIILTVSNHAPYSVDLAKAGFDEAGVVQQLPEGAKEDQDLIKRLGHFWYMDKLIAEFTKDMRSRYPDDSLFIITGDHADRTNIESKPGMFERYTVPFIVYGNGINKNTLPENAAGGHVNLGATLIELIAPEDFAYYTLGESLTRGSRVGFNHSIWITPGMIGEIDAERMAVVNEQVVSDPLSEKAEAVETLAMMRTISWWRTMKGNEIK